MLLPGHGKLRPHRHCIPDWRTSSRDPRAAALNPYGDGDRAFFVGAPAGGRRLPPDRIWLGVFLQAHNDSDRPRRAAGAITLADSFDHVFRPVPLGADNTYAYRPTTLAAGDSEPGPSSPAAYSPEQGSLLLFDVPLTYFMSNRPLELRVSGHGRFASVQLDV